MIKDQPTKSKVASRLEKGGHVPQKELMSSSWPHILYPAGKDKLVENVQFLYVSGIWANTTNIHFYPAYAPGS